MALYTVGIKGIGKNGSVNYLLNNGMKRTCLQETQAPMNLSEVPMSNAKMAVHKFQPATVKTNYFRMKKRLFILTLLIITSAIIGGVYVINSTGTGSCTGKGNGNTAGANAAVNAAPRTAMPALPVAGTIHLNNRTLNKANSNWGSPDKALSAVANVCVTDNQGSSADCGNQLPGFVLTYTLTNLNRAI